MCRAELRARQTWWRSSEMARHAVVAFSHAGSLVTCESAKVLLVAELGPIFLRYRFLRDDAEISSSERIDAFSSDSFSVESSAAASSSEFSAVVALTFAISS